MNSVPDLREIPDLPDEIVQAGLNGDLVLFVGSGVSRLLSLPSWTGIALLQLRYLRDKGVLNFSELEQLSALDAKKQLSIAIQLADDNELELDLTAGLSGYSEANSIYKSLNDIGCVCVTTNYDELLSPRYSDADDGSQAPVIPKRIFKKSDLLVTHLDTPGTVVHLHGAVSVPSTMVVTTAQYLEHYDNEYVQSFLGNLFERKTVLFIGYGLEEAELLEHLLRRGRASAIEERKRFVLQGYYLSQSPLYSYLHTYYRKSFGVHVIGFIRDYEDYGQQQSIFRDWAPRIEVNRPSLDVDMARINEVLGG